MKVTFRAMNENDNKVLGCVFFDVYIDDIDSGRIYIDLNRKKICFCKAEFENIIDEQLLKDFLEKESGKWVLSPKHVDYYTGIGETIKIDDCEHTLSSGRIINYKLATIKIGEKEMKFSDYDYRDYCPKFIGEKVDVGCDMEGQYIVKTNQSNDLKYKKSIRTFDYWKKCND